MRRNDLPEEVLRQASDRLKRQAALTTMAVAHGDVRMFVVHLLCAAGRSDVEPFLLSAEE